MRIREDENGQMLVMTALSLLLLIGFLALAIDVGVLFRAQRNMQIAADAGAIAAALNYAYSTSPNPTSAADSAAAANGVTNANYVTVNNPAVNGYHTGAGFIEVIVSEPNPTYFMSLFGINPVNVAARAVAGTIPNPSCIYVLDPTDSSTLQLQGSYQVNTPNCGVLVDSSSSSAICITGSSSAGYFNAPYIRVFGAQGSAGNCKGSITGTTIQNGVSPIQDPFANMTEPPLTACNSANTVTAATVTSATTIPASSYLPVTGGSTVALTCFANPNPLQPVTLSNVTLGSTSTTTTNGVTNTVGSNSIFLFENGVTISGSVTVGGTLDNYQGTLSQGNNVLNVYAPAGTSLPYNGIGIMQPNTNTTGTCSPSVGEPAPCLQLQFGASGGTSSGGYGNLNGLIYAPTSTVYLQDGGGGVVTTGIISYKLVIGPSGLNITNSYNSANPSTTPLKTVAMVE